MKNVWLFFIVSFIIACDDTKKEKEVEHKQSVGNEIFPVASFFNEQISYVDSMRLPIIKSITINGKTTSNSISQDEFNTLAKEFIEADISKPPFKDRYKETNFADQSIPSITLTYNAESQDLEIRRMDVIIKPSPVANDEVKTVYIEKATSNHDTSILKKLYWKADKNFQIIISKQIGNQAEQITKMKIAWDSAD